MPNTNGKDFEKLIKDSSEQMDIDFTRFIDAGYLSRALSQVLKRLQIYEPNFNVMSRFAPSNICDCLLLYRGVSVFCEAKSYQSAIPFKDIRQRKRLPEKWKPEKGVLSGLVCFFRNKDCYYFIPQPMIDAIEIGCGKKSFNANDAAQFGIKIDSVVLPGKRKVLLNLPTLIRELHGRYIKQTK